MMNNNENIFNLIEKSNEPMKKKRVPNRKVTNPEIIDTLDRIAGCSELIKILVPKLRNKTLHVTEVEYYKERLTRCREEKLRLASRLNELNKMAVAEARARRGSEFLNKMNNLENKIYATNSTVHRD